MPFIDSKKLNTYRRQTYHTHPNLRVHTRDQAVEYVGERGFVHFWPIKDIELPSLWGAVAGDRPVADAHDDPGHVTWGWKDSLLGSKQWYYAKVLRKKATMISPDMVPYFYALSENYGAPEEDYLTIYEQGRLTLEARQVYEALLYEGALDTIDLRKATHMTNRESDSRFNRALIDLQVDFRILPVGVSQAGRWHYAFIYDVVHRCYPELIEAAHPISEKAARQAVLETYFRSVGAAQLRDVVLLFGWSRREAERALDAMVQTGMLVPGAAWDGKKGDWLGIPDVIGI